MRREYFYRELWKIDEWRMQELEDGNDTDEVAAAYDEMVRALERDYEKEVANGERTIQH